MAVIFAKQMCDEIKTQTGCPDYIIVAHMKIIDYVLQGNGILSRCLFSSSENSKLDEIKTTCNKIVQLFESVLSRFKIKNATVIRCLFRFILGNIASTSEINQYLDSCLSHSREEEEVVYVLPTSQITERRFQ